MCVCVCVRVFDNWNFLVLNTNAIISVKTVFLKDQSQTFQE